MKNPAIMGILNCTPDSFYDGGFYPGVAALVDHALKMADEGADWIDIGGESTRPGASPVAVAEERERVIPVIRGIRRHRPVALSIDTTKAAVAREAIDCGATLVNDISALGHDDAMAGLVARAAVRIILMHARGDPATMHTLTDYGEVVTDVIRELDSAINRAKQAGVTDGQILVDPGFGFAKTPSQNGALLQGLKAFGRWGYPVAVGLSRKSFLGAITGTNRPQERLPASLAAAIIAVREGAAVLRVHDVAETRQALEFFEVFS